MGWFILFYIGMILNRGSIVHSASPFPMILVANLISLMHHIAGQWRQSEGSHWTFNTMEESTTVGH